MKRASAGFLDLSAQAGRVEAQVERQLDTVEQAFGSPALALMPEVRASNDPDRLRQLLVAIRGAATVDELRAQVVGRMQG